MFDPLPILCRACGGPVPDAEQAAWRCPHCDTPDELPRDLQARVFELRRRIDLRARQLTRLSNAEAALALAFEEPGRLKIVLTPIVAMMVAFLVPTLINTVTHPGAPPTAMLILLPGIPVAIAGAFFIGRHIYRRELRGCLQPLAPRQPSARARCRCCGAELPRDYAPLVRCRHCHVHSLVTATQSARQSQELAAQTLQGAGQLRDLAGRTASFGHRLDRVFGASFVVLYVVCMALNVLLR